MRKILSILLITSTILLSSQIAIAYSDDYTLKVASGEYEQWIDRAILPEIAASLYDTLVEATNNDGYADYLIEDNYLDLSSNTLKIEDLSSVEVGQFVKVNDTINTSNGARHLEFCGILTGKFHNTFNDNQISIKKEYIHNCCSIAWSTFFKDHPEVFWLNKDMHFYEFIQTSIAYQIGKVDNLYMFALFSSSDDNGKSTALMSGYTEDSIKEGINQREEYTSNILSEIDENDTTYNKIYKLNRWLVDNNEYNSIVKDGGSGATETAWTCMSALSGSSGISGPVCEGYSKAFKVLCDRLNIPCVLVSGLAVDNRYNTPQNHMWNYVKLDDYNWYAVDVTWNDPYITGGGTPSEDVHTDYLLVGSETRIGENYFGATHIVTNEAGSSLGTVELTNGPYLSNGEYKNYEIDSMNIIKTIGEEAGKLENDIVDEVTDHNSANGKYIIIALILLLIFKPRRRRKRR